MRLFGSKPLRVFALFFILAAMAWSVSARADGAKWAVLVGIDKYDSENITPLEYAVADVKAVGETLTTRLGYQADHVLLLTSDQTGKNRPTAANILLRLDALSEEIRPGDTFLFYFSGHGFQRGSDDTAQNFLGTVDTESRSLATLRQTALQLDNLKEAMKEIKARQVVFIIDACRNDPERGGRGDANTRTTGFTKALKRVVISGDAGEQGTAILFACKEGERSYEAPEYHHGAFTHFLLEGLDGKAPTPNGQLTIDDLADYVDNKLRERNETSGQKQHPELCKSGGAARIVLAEHQGGPHPAPDNGGGNVVVKSTVAKLAITSDPPGAQIYVNGEPVPNIVTPATIERELGLDKTQMVEVGLRLDGYKDLVLNVTLQRGGRVTIEKALEKRAAPKPSPLPDDNSNNLPKDEAQGRKRVLAAIQAHGGDIVADIKTITLKGKGELDLPNKNAPPTLLAVQLATLNYAEPDKMRLYLLTSNGPLTIAGVGAKGWSSLAGKVEDYPIDNSLAGSGSDPIVLLGRIVRRKYVVRALPGTENDDSSRDFSVTDEKGNVANVYIDAQTGLISRIVTGKSAQETVLDFTDYRRSSGILYPMSQTMTMGGSQMYRFNLDHAEFNKELSDNLFVKPAPGDLSGPEPAPEDDTKGLPQDEADGRRILRATVQAYGGSAFTHMKSMVLKASGTTAGRGPDGSPMPVPIQSVYVFVAPDKTRAVFSSGSVQNTVVRIGNRGWASAGGQTQDLTFDLAVTDISDPIILLNQINLKKYTVRALPNDDSDSSRVISITDEHGKTARAYLDPKTGLITRMIGKSGQQDIVITFSNYRNISGIFYPMLQTVTSGGAEQARINVDSIEFNRAVPESIFAKPGE